MSDPRQLFPEALELEGHLFEFLNLKVLNSDLLFVPGGSAPSVRGTLALQYEIRIDGMPRSTVQDLHLSAAFDPATGEWNDLAVGGWLTWLQHAGVSRGDHAAWTPGIWVPKLRGCVCAAWDTMAEDLDHDGRMDGGKNDTDHDGEWDLEWKDRHGNGKPDAGEWREIRPPSPVPTAPRPRIWQCSGQAEDEERLQIG